MKNLSSKIENAFLIFCGLGLFIMTLWLLFTVFSSLANYSYIQLCHTVLLACVLLILQLGIAGIVYANKNF